jgi:hypothetical protein
MKNIHVLPTNKPSRLHLKSDGFYLTKEENSFIPYSYPQNIYITSDEEIKEGDWFTSVPRGTIHKCTGIFENNLIDNTWENREKVEITKADCKKIILTTDQDLIKDGVQSIDDDFLEWFVKNPSCESVDVNDWIDTNGNIAFGGNIRYQISCSTYKEITIPQEESKQEYKYIGECNGNNDNGCFLDSPAYDCGCFTRVVKEKPKQETLEEAIKQELENHFFSNISEIKQAEYFINFGALWQQEQDKKMYSEGEVEIIIQKLMNDVHCGDLCYGDNVIDFKMSPRQWFEQFKKK